MSNEKMAPGFYRMMREGQSLYRVFVNQQGDIEREELVPEDFYLSPKEMRRMAALHKAAPEMLEALKECLEFLTIQYHKKSRRIGAIKALNAVIAKAEGKENA